LNTSDFIHTVYAACFCCRTCDPSPVGEQEGDDEAAAAGRGRGWILAIIEGVTDEEGREEANCSLLFLFLMANQGCSE
jgi:hypothetical protein